MPADFPKDLDRVCMYLRKSRADIEAEARGEGETLSKHRKALTELANHFRYNVRAIYQEIVSGEHISDRPEMQRLLRDVEAGKWQAVLCMDLDRLGRGDMIDQGTIFNTFKNSNTLIITPRKVYNLDDELDEEWSEFEAFLARRELKIITRRLQRGRIASIKEGRYIGTRPPFGYDKGPDGVLIPNKDADIVRMIFNWYVYGENGERMGSTKIARRLNEIGIKSYTNKEWEPSTVRAVLQNDVYIGMLHWKKVYRDRSRRISYRRPNEEWISVKGKHEPIIDEETFYAAQEIAKQRRIVPTKKKPRNPFAGLVICGVCGRKMVMKGGNSDRIFTIACYDPTCPNKATSFRIFERKIFSIIKSELNNLLLNQEEIEKEISSATENNNSQVILSSLKEQLKELENQRSRIQDLLEQGIYDIPTYLERNKIISGRIEAVKKAISETESEIARYKEKENLKKTIMPTIQHVLDAYHLTNDVTKKNALLKTIIEKIVYRKDKSAKLDNFEVDIYFKI